MTAFFPGLLPPGRPARSGLSAAPSAALSAGSPSRRALLRLGATAVTTSALGACTALPTSGEVHESDIQARDPKALIQTAPGPAQDASAEEIVRGFLRAAVAGFSDDFATAREFLSSGAAKRWEPLEAVEIYSGSTERQIAVAEDGSVTVTVGSQGRIGSDGVLTPATQDAVYEGSYSLAKNSTGQWRIVTLPEGILLPYSRLTQHFASHALCFLSQDRQRVVPELRWFLRASMDRSVVEGLLAGPSSWLSPGVVSLVPHGAALAKEGVVVDGHTATVHLTSESDPGSAQARALLVSQLTLTLSGVGDITDVQVRAGGTDLGRAAALPSLQPDVGGVVGMVDGSVVRGTGTTRSTLATAQALGDAEARSPALGADGNVFVVSGTSLLCLRQGEEAASVILSGGEPEDGQVEGGGRGLERPVADRHGWVWLLVQGRLMAVSAAGQQAVLDSSWVQGQELSAFDLSVESERLALRRSDGSVVLAVVLRDDSGAPVGLGEPLEVPSAAVERSTGVSWCTALAVGVLVAADEKQEGAVPQIQVAQVGGMVSTTVGVSGAQSVIANRSEEPVLLSDDRQQIWQRRGATWRVLTDEVTDLSYPLP